ncbi:zinc ABC transporter substrate-binding protein [Actinobacteria bacterium YIM 96077]|uniref:Zinc ABC transporter substrate-binding protein n=1 Tax=Phytoactinopolyspora halophila TaxID=1981511 RepID=A0A329QEQ6_9ACTN|nr:metal ABC transporter substrate-binding protein [Phytoactinopolyspora halophila]AYY14056.1 zinc ABC transporter substrate-binding protein [Actinobacteria bacterium YIM 96077]RAW10963.1 zinc ABC transporter substrate-binding protein [Phytoactinopolyspora halophila]
MRTRLPVRSLVVLAASGMALTGCGTDGDSEAASTSNGDPFVVAGFYPLAFAAEHVAGEHGSVVNLTQPGVDSHDLELTAQQVGHVSDADLNIYLDGFQPAVDQAIEQNSSAAVIDVADLVELLPEDGASGHDSHADDHTDEDDEHEQDHDHDEDGHHDDESDHEDEQGDDHGDGEHDHGDSHDHSHDHGDGDGDPHLWLDPTNMVTITRSIADELAEIDPDNAEDYQNNADELVQELETLDDEFHEGLAQCERSLIVVSHEAFGYLTHRYEMEQLGVAGLDPDSEPSPARVAEVHDTIESNDITTVFYEPLTSADIVQTVADDLGLETAVLDPVEGLTDETSDEDYLSLMRQNLDALRTANGCT